MRIASDSQLIVLHDTVGGQPGRYSFASVLANEPLGDILIKGLLSNKCCKRTYLAMPAAWELKSGANHILRYSNSIPLTSAELCDNSNSYLIITNGRFQTEMNCSRLRKIVSSFKTDVVTVNVETTLLASQEKLRLTSQGYLAGIRRVYADSVQRSTMPADWPCYVFIRKSCLKRIINADGIPTGFDDFIKLLSKDVTLSSINIGASLLDVETPQGLLAFITEVLKSSGYESAIPEDIRCNGEVMIGQNVNIGNHVRLIGPAIICDNVDIADGAVIARTIVGSNVKIQAGQIVNDQLLIKDPDRNCVQEFKSLPSSTSRKSVTNFRRWPRLSYARFFKRTADIIISAVVLILFVPVIAIIGTLIKLTSRGPAFFGHQRQSLHGKNFRCFKFRSMIIGADDLQAKLRIKNEVDGPQFKMDDDPRVTQIGKFLRDTYLDEIPQFFNVLVGDMSVIGPRPSPETENSLCACWRDARLSVRPGITGLWQVCRTRKAGSDFQEWVHYDSQYVRQLSFKLDLWIFWGTAKHMIRSFLRQF